jgi:hypothetical protein
MLAVTSECITRRESAVSVLDIANVTVNIGPPKARPIVTHQEESGVRSGRIPGIVFVNQVTTNGPLILGPGASFTGRCGLTAGDL